MKGGKNGGKGAQVAGQSRPVSSAAEAAKRGPGVSPGARLVAPTGRQGKLAMAYFDYRKHGQFEWAGPVILFVCLVFVLLAPNYIWGIIGI